MSRNHENFTGRQHGRDKAPDMPVSPRYTAEDFLPTTVKEMRARGWEQVDVVIFSGDAYVAHPSFAAAVLGRTLFEIGG